MEIKFQGFGRIPFFPVFRFNAFSNHRPSIPEAIIHPGGHGLDADYHNRLVSLESLMHAINTLPAFP